MAFSSVPSVATSDSWTASQHNTYIKDNFSAVWVGTTAGDIDYYTSATAKQRLALTTGGILIGGASAPQYLSNTSGGVLIGGASSPEYLAAGAAYTVLKSDGTTPAYGAVTHRRQGGSSTVWATAGTTTYTPSSELVQKGVIALSLSGGTGTASVTFPVAYSQLPHVILTIRLLSGSARMSAPTIYSLSTTGFTVEAYHLDSGTFSINVHWQASGQ